MRAMDAVLAFLLLILAMAVSIGMGAGVTSAAVGIMITSIPWYARLLRSDALSLRSRPFIEAARALGAGRARNRAPAHPAARRADPAGPGRQRVRCIRSLR